MSTTSNIYTQYVGESDGRGESGKLWKDCPWADIKDSLNRGYAFEDDFLTFNPTGTVYTSTSATSGTTALDDAAGGVLLLDSGATVQGQGETMQMGTTVGECWVTSTTGDLWFETRIKVVDTYDDCELFAGLSEIDTSLIASQANTSANHIGFECVTNDGVLTFHAEVAGTRTSASATIGTLAEDTWVKLGFHVKRRNKILVYVDGVLMDTLTTGFPLLEMTPSFVCQAGGTADPILHIDWFRVAAELSAS
jgi:hypothetical protein